MAVKLDAVKAFDLLWREALFYKLKIKNFNKNEIILRK